MTAEEKANLLVPRVAAQGVQVPAELERSQFAARRWQEWQAQFGLGYTAGELHERIRKVAPFRFGYQRSTRWTSILSYTQLIPDAAIERYKEAKAAGLQHFYVVEPAYTEAQRAQDPWLVATLGPIIDGVGLREREESILGIVLAYWE